MRDGGGIAKKINIVRCMIEKMVVGMNNIYTGIVIIMFLKNSSILYCYICRYLSIYFCRKNVKYVVKYTL